jgi:hypothetical protein
MEMVKKKPEVLRNLPGNENNVLGITFEELQIAKIMAEAIRKNVPIELIATEKYLPVFVFLKTASAYSGVFISLPLYLNCP